MKNKILIKAILLLLLIITAPGCQKKLTNPAPASPPPEMNTTTPKPESNENVDQNPETPPPDVATPPPTKTLADYQDWVGKNNFSLDIWVYEDGENTFEWPLEVFKRQFPNVEVRFKSFATEKSIWNELKNAKNNKQLPDIMTIKNGWMPLYKNYLTPAPNDLIEVETVNKEFFPLVTESFVDHNQVFALPLFVRSLAMFSNQELLRDDRITVGDAPEKMWPQFLQNAKNFNKYNTSNKKFVALGWQESAPKTLDIFITLLLQAGLNPQDTLSDKKEALDALSFLTYFINPEADSFSWDQSRSSDLTAFLNGEIAVIFGDESTQNKMRKTFLDVARTKNTDALLENFLQISEIPQFSKNQTKATLGESWGLAVSQKSPNPQTAWLLVSFLTNKDNSRDYALKTSKTPARINLTDNFFIKNAQIARSPGRLGNFEFEEVFKENIAKLMQQKISREEALQNMDKFLNAQR